MDKKNIIDRFVDIETNIKHKIITRKYTEINNIFGDKNKAYPFKDCLIDYNYMQIMNLIYSKNLLFRIYNYYIEEIANLIYDIRPDASLEEVMYIYVYLLFNGYLSKDNNFNFLFPDKEFNMKMSLSAIYGQGVCRNVGDLLSDIYSMYGVENYGIITDRSTYKTEPMESWDKFAKLLNNEMVNFIEVANEYYKDHKPTTGDHYELLVKDGKWKVFDPSNIAIYNISTKDNGYDALHYLKLWSLYAQGECSIKKVTKFYNFLKNKYLYLYNCKDKIILQKDCYENCEKEKQKIKKFHNNNYCYIDKLSIAVDCLQKK